MLKLMRKKIFTIVRSIIFLSRPMNVIMCEAIRILPIAKINALPHAASPPKEYVLDDQATKNYSCTL